MSELGCFEDVYEQYQPLLYGTLKKYSIYKNQEDILQEARVALWEAYAKFNPERGDFSAYAARYVRGRVLSLLTREYKLKQTYTFSQLSNPEQEVELEWVDEVAEDAYLLCELAEIVGEAALSLSAREKLILEEHLLLERPLRELAAREGVSVETAKTWRKRALKKLRENLSPFLEEKDI